MAGKRAICFLIGFLLFFLTTFLLLPQEPSSGFNIIQGLTASPHHFLTAGLIGFSGGILGLLLGFFYVKRQDDST